MALPAYALNENHGYSHPGVYDNIYRFEISKKEKLEVIQSKPMVFRFIPGDMQRELQSYENEYLNRLNKILASRLQASANLFVGDITKNNKVYIQSHTFNFSESMQITNILVESIIWMGNQVDRELRSKM